MKVLWDIGGAIDAPSAHHVSIDDTTLQYDASDPYAGYILLPRDSTLTNIQHYIGSELVDPAALREAATVQVVDSADEDSLGDSFAGIWTRLLSMIGFTMAQPDSLRTAPPTTQVLDFSGGRAAATARWLAAYFGGSVVTESPEEAPQALPAGSPTPSLSPSPVQAQIVVQIGQDFAGAFDHEQRPAGSAPPADYNAPNPSPTLFPEGSPSPSPEVSPSLSPSPTPQPSASASASGSPHTEPSPSASPAPSGTPVATPSPRPSPSPPRPTPT
jgi:hypothetical protein